MPLPKPRSGEEQDEFVSRCMGNDTMREDFPEQDQRLAVCFSQWRDRKGTEPMQTKELRPILDLKELDSKSGAITGYASVFNNVDLQGDIVRPGAYAGSLSEHKRKGTKPKMFWQHNPREPIGKWVKFAEDGKGLIAEGQLNLEVQRGREALALLKDECIDGLSVGFRPIKMEPDEKGRMQLLELGLVEVSIVSLAANERARIDSVKNSPESWWELDARLREWDGTAETSGEFKKDIEDFLQNQECPKSLRPLFAKRLLVVDRSESEHEPPIRSESEGNQAMSEAIKGIQDAVAKFLEHSER